MSTTVALLRTKISVKSDNDIGGLHMTSSKNDNANYGQFAPNFDMAYKTMQGASVSNLKLFGPMKTVIWAKETGEFSTKI